MTDLAFWVDIFTIASGVATAALVGVALWQSRQTQQQMNSTLRPWLGVIDLKLDASSVYAICKNFGSLPSTSCTIRKKHGPERISRDSLYAAESSDGGIIWPQDFEKYHIPFDAKQFNDAIEAISEFYLGILVQYTYANNKKAEHGVIYSYHAYSNTFKVIDTWFGPHNEKGHLPIQ